MKAMKLNYVTFKGKLIDALNCFILANVEPEKRERLTLGKDSFDEEVLDLVVELSEDYNFLSTLKKTEESGCSIDFEDLGLVTTFNPYPEDGDPILGFTKAHSNETIALGVLATMDEEKDYPINVIIFFNSDGDLALHVPTRGNVFDKENGKPFKLWEASEGFYPVDLLDDFQEATKL